MAKLQLRNGIVTSQLRCHSIKPQQLYLTTTPTLFGLSVLFKSKTQKDLLVGLSFLHNIYIFSGNKTCKI